jgi:hypothetical protein
MELSTGGVFYAWHTTSLGNIHHQQNDRYRIGTPKPMYSSQNDDDTTASWRNYSNLQKGLSSLVPLEIQEKPWLDALPPSHHINPRLRQACFYPVPDFSEMGENFPSDILKLIEVPCVQVFELD